MTSRSPFQPLRLCDSMILCLPNPYLNRNCGDADWQLSATEQPVTITVAFCYLYLVLFFLCQFYLPAGIMISPKHHSPSPKLFYNPVNAEEYCKGELMAVSISELFLMPVATLVLKLNGSSESQCKEEGSQYDITAQKNQSWCQFAFLYLHSLMPWLPRKWVNELWEGFPWMLWWSIAWSKCLFASLH